MPKRTKQTKREEGRREGPQRRGGQRERGKRGEGRSERRIRRRSDVGTSKADPWLDGDDGELRHCGVCMVDGESFYFCVIVSIAF